MVASSGNISDYVNAQQYSDVASQQINDAIGQIKVLKAGLQKQQQDVDQVLADQNSEEAQVASNQQQQQQLLNETQGSEAAYQAQIASGNSQIQSLIQQQIAAELAKQAAYGGTLIMGPGDPNSGGYPSNWRSAAQDSLVDYWNMYNRECVSYAAFKVEQTFGSLSKAATGNPIFSSWGNANSWPYNARAAGYTVDQNPTVHSVAQFNDNVAGHVAWVESVNGSDITVSQFNYSFGGKIPHGVYSTMTVGKTYFNNYIHFN
jgi:surface antigen